ncbi:hypothetical protein [Thiocystis minor]|uniref:hypothetical protein n=1 Tax=Thiocystis minor TaxID=61597 RepID=UPI001A936341|nr:hypothetical protein [Thiocystis minor]
MGDCAEKPQALIEIGPKSANVAQDQGILARGFEIAAETPGAGRSGVAPIHFAC